MTASPVVEMRDITVGFPGVKALDGVDFRLLPGEVHALMGENGAGKSTLIKALTGVYGIDAGTITVRGRGAGVRLARARRRTPGSARSTRRSTSAPISLSRRTSCSAASRAGSGASTGAPSAAGPPSCSRGSTWPSTRIRSLGGHPLAVQQLVAIARASTVDAARADPRRAHVQPRRRRGRASCSG